jgi:hypothetical protein
MVEFASIRPKLKVPNSFVCTSMFSLLTVKYHQLNVQHFAPRQRFSNVSTLVVNHDRGYLVKNRNELQTSGCFLRQESRGVLEEQ